MVERMIIYTPKVARAVYEAKGQLTLLGTRTMERDPLPNTEFLFDSRESRIIKPSGHDDLVVPVIDSGDDTIEVIRSLRNMAPWVNLYATKGDSLEDNPNLRFYTFEMDPKEGLIQARFPDGYVIMLDEEVLRNESRLSKLVQEKRPIFERTYSV